MDINSRQGTPVIFSGHNGYSKEQESARGILRVGETYVIDWIEVGSWATEIGLSGFPGKSFNSVMFENVPENMDAKSMSNNVVTSYQITPERDSDNSNAHPIIVKSGHDIIEFDVGDRILSFDKQDFLRIMKSIEYFDKL